MNRVFKVTTVNYVKIFNLGNAVRIVEVRFESAVHKQLPANACEIDTSNGK